MIKSKYSLILCVYQNRCSIINICLPHRSTNIIYFDKVSRMDNILYITIFLVCILICSGVSCILYKYQDTISPVNQNVITKLSSFCVQLITPVVYIEVHHACNLHISMGVHLMIHKKLSLLSMCIWCVIFNFSGNFCVL